LSGELFQYRTANVENSARLDVAADGFWEHRKKAFFEVKVFNPLAPSYVSILVLQVSGTGEEKDA